MPSASAKPTRPFKPLDRQPSVPLEKLLQMIAQGMVHADLVSTLAARLARLDSEMDNSQRAEISKVARQPLKTLTARLLASFDPDRTIARAIEQFKLAPDAEPTEQQLDAAEQAAMMDALKPLHDPELRKTILAIKASLEQVIDEVTPDTLLRAAFDATSLARARSLVADFKQFIREHKDEIEAIQLLYSKPYRAGLRYRHVTELAAKLNRAPFAIRPDDPESIRPLWDAHAAAEPLQIKGKGGGAALVDLVALVRHAIHPQEPVLPVRAEVEQNYAAWLAEQEQQGGKFTPDQRQWLDAIRDHIAQSLAIEAADFDEVPFSGMGGLGKVHQLFGERLPKLLEELNERLAA